MFPRLPRRTSAALVAASLLLAGPARAEDLLQIFDLARNHDAGILAAEQQYQALATRVTQSRGALLPNLALVRSETRERYTPDGSDAGSETRVGTLALNLKQSLLNGGLWTDLDIAHATRDSARLDYELAMQDFILQVAQAYFNVLTAQDVLETRKLSKEAIASQLDAAIRKFKSGLGIITDQEEAQARYSLAEADEIAASNELRVARLALARLTGRPGIAPKALAGSTVLPPLEAGALPDLLRMTERHPSVLRARLALVKARLDTRRAKSALLPTLDLVGNVSKNSVRGSANPVNPLPTGRSTTSSVGLELNLPLFSGFSQMGRISETVHLQEQARDLAEVASRAAEEATERAYYDLQSSLARAKALAAAEAASQSSLEGTQRSYKAGLRQNLDVLNAQSQLYQTRSELARVRYEVLIRSLRLRAAVGRLDQSSLAEINRLL